MNKLILKLNSFRKQSITLFKGLACFILIVVTSAFQAEPQNTPPSSLEDGNILVTLQSQEFSTYANRVHNTLTYEDHQDTINLRTLTYALRGYTYLRYTGALQSEKFLTVIDFSLYCNTKRLWVIDMETKKVVMNEYVAHGEKSGDTYAKYFSNSHSSHKSSLGFYATGGLYYGSNNLSLKLHGLEKRYNSNAFARGIVIHGANYVSDQIVDRKERIGRSFGCPAVSQRVNKRLVNTIKGGNCLFIFHPTNSYIEESEYVNANLYITVDDLRI